ncbi:hypothetical protein G6F22_011572 [Rhizopus arrhizus]|nr:hypothetical protein G6F22_011572 [Rhizopus arrhizus]
MSVVLGYPGFWVQDPRAGIDWVKVVHGEQRLTVHAPLPTSGVVIGKSRNTHVIDKGADKGAIVITERTLHDESGACLATLRQSTFCRGDGGFGQGDDSPEALPAVPGGKPDLQCELRVPPSAALLYRGLSTADPARPVLVWRGGARHRQKLLRLRRVAADQPERAVLGARISRRDPAMRHLAHA